MGDEMYDKAKISKIGGTTLWVVIVSVGLWGIITFNISSLKKKQVLLKAHIETACPTLFSVARTPRDTLLVMRSESNCIEYVLKTLK